MQELKFNASSKKRKFKNTLWKKRYPEVPKPSPSHALIIFNRFSAAWEKINGWRAFYGEEKLRNKFPTVPLDIAQFNNETLKPAPEAQELL